MSKCTNVTSIKSVQGGISVIRSIRCGHGLVMCEETSPGSVLVVAAVQGGNLRRGLCERGGCPHQRGQNAPRAPVLIISVSISVVSLWVDVLPAADGAELGIALWVIDDRDDLSGWRKRARRRVGRGVDEGMRGMRRTRG